MAQSLKGTSWGTPEIDQHNFSLMVNQRGLEKILIRVPHDRINNSIVNKQDVILDINTQDCNADEDMLCEIRFFAESKQDEEVKQAFAERINNQILQKAKITQFKGQSLCTILEVNLSVPRGKYTCDFYQKNLRFHGSTFNINIEYKNIVKMFFLPLPTQMISLVIHLSKPVILGKTTHHFILIQLKKDIEIQVKTKIKPQHVKVNPGLESIKAQYSGLMHDVFTQVLHGFVGVVMLIPGDQMKSKQGHHSIKCNLKTHPGWLFFIKKSMIFIQKPTIYIKFQQLACIQFERINSSINKLFDMKVILRKGDKKQQSLTFAGFQRFYLEKLNQYFNKNGVKTINKTEQQKPRPIIDGSQDQSQDDDFKANDDDEEDDQSQSFEADQQVSK